MSAGRTTSASPRTTTSTQGNVRCSAAPMGPSQLAPPNTMVSEGSRCLRSLASTRDGTFWLKVEAKPTTRGPMARTSSTACARNPPTRPRIVTALASMASGTPPWRRKARYRVSAAAATAETGTVDQLLRPAWLQLGGDGAGLPCSTRRAGQARCLVHSRLQSKASEQRLLLVLDGRWLQHAEETGWKGMGGG